MPVKPDRNDLHAWLTPQLMRECEQALHRHGMDTATIPYAWQTMQHLHARIEQHAEAIVRDLTEALQALETHRQQAGLTKVFLSSPVVRSCYAACPSAAHKVIKVLARDRVYAVTS